MVQAADLWNLHDRAESWWRDRPGLRRILRQREMSSRLVVVREVTTQDARQSGFIRDDHVIETLASDGTDQPFRIRVLPRGTRGGAGLLDAHSRRRGRERGERVVAIVKEIARGRVFRKRLAELLRRPSRGRMRGDADVHDAATAMGQDNQHEQQPIRDVDAKLQEFAVDSRRTLERIRLRHRANQRANVRRDHRSTEVPPAFPRPEEPESLTMPRQDGLGSTDRIDQDPIRGRRQDQCS
jgi:hypothetical protein